MGAAQTGLAGQTGPPALSRNERLASAVTVVHPGPSLLVTAVFLAAGGLAAGGVPPADLAARMVLIMLPAQFAIGAVNDLADLESDRLGKPGKPLVAGSVGRRTVMALAAVCVGVSLITAARSGGAVLAAVLLGLGAGLAYDVRLKRRPLAVLCWWAGFAALPLAACAAAGALTARLLWEVPLTGLLALSLLCANALPDLDADRAAGVGSLPVRLGEAGTRRAGLAAALATSVLAALLAKLLGQNAAVPAAAGLFALVSAVTLGSRSVRRPFPWVAAAAAMLAVTWLAALPH